MCTHYETKIKTKNKKNNTLQKVLLAPTSTMDPSVPVEEVAEPVIKHAGMQTMYRESEAQTMPYTPAHVVPDGTTPEVLLLKDLKYENGGLSVGKKELEMIEYARLKRDVESNLPPFTDEASMNLRKRMMESQELREFNLRESEIDARREARIFVLEQALREKNESAEFLASQRVESIRQNRMEERETNLQKIRNKRIKVLRKLANRRNQQDPQLSSTEPKDIIDSYFDKASEVYAPIRRKGELNNIDSNKFEVNSRTASLAVAKNVMALEDSIPSTIKSSTVGLGAPLNPMNPPKQLNETGYLLEKKGGRAAEPRMTSAALRFDRIKKRDVEEMARIIAKQKISDRGATRGSTSGAATPGSLSKTNTADGGNEDGMASPESRLPSKTLGPRGVKVRPASPDFVRTNNTEREENLPLSIALVIIQKLIRGRAVQNMMYEGRYRRAELIAELRNADEIARMKSLAASSTEEVGEAERDAEREKAEKRLARDKKLKDITVDSTAGSISSNLVYSLVQEQNRNEMMADMNSKALLAVEDRRTREAVEAGRRQREYMRMPIRPELTEGGEGEEVVELEPVTLSRDINRPYTPPEAESSAAIMDIVETIISKAVENVSRPNTAAEGESDEASRGSLERSASGVAGEVAESSGSGFYSGSSELEGSEIDPNLMAALGVADSETPKVETDWKPPEESGIEAAQTE